jgi:hypothetical protein
VRVPVVIGLLFTLGLAAATVVDFVRHGVTGLGIVSACLVALFGVALVGMIRQPPRE